MVTRMLKRSQLVRKVFNLFFDDEEIEAPFVITFGDVGKGDPLIIKDDYGRIEIPLNQDFFAKNHDIKIGDDFVIEKR